MLYVNAYLVGQAYGGSEEGGWYYSIFTPLASIPIPAKRELGKTYFLSTVNDKTVICVEECHICNGSGEVEGTEDDNDAPDDRYGYLCSNENQCSYIPKDIDATCKIIDGLQELFKDEPGRRESIRVSLEDKFAEASNNYAPYE